MIKSSIVLIFSLLLSSCSFDNTVRTNPITGETPNPGIFSKDSDKGISLDEVLNPQAQGDSSINVNGFLWRASLNILSIAPLISTDALGGTIITDWYLDKNIKNQRIKIMAYIKSSELRSDGISVKVHIQKLVNNSWSDTYTNNKLARQIENSILNEARNLRINALK